MPTTYKVTSEPALEPITLGSVKDRLRITVNEFDNELYDLIRTARQAVEYDTHRKLVTQTVAIYFDKFPSGEWMELRLVPISAITSIAYIDTAGDSQTFDSSNYNTDLDHKPPRVRLVDGSSWPAVDDVPQAVTVTVTAGTAAESVPVEAKLAMVEWIRMNWGDCDGDAKKYNALINRIAWSGHWIAV